MEENNSSEESNISEDLNKELEQSGQPESMII